MDFAKFQRLVSVRPGFEVMENPTASGEYFSDSCGDMYTLYLKVGPGAIIEDISYFTTGCGFGVATCSLLVDLARGKTVEEASAITTGDIEAALDGYPEKKKDYPERVLDALKVAIDDYREKRAKGEIPDFASMPAPEKPAVQPVAESDASAGPLDADGKVLIRLH